MGCNCGGGRQAAQRAATVAAGGTPVAWRLVHPSGGTVDYWDEKTAQTQQAKVPGSTVMKVDVRTGQQVK